jgi:hypothetical protein
MENSVVIAAYLKIGYESTELSCCEACEITRKARLSINVETELVREAKLPGVRHGRKIQYHDLPPLSRIFAPYG